MTRSVTLTGLSGNQYQYEVYDTNVTWNPVPGNYVLAAHVGQTLLTEEWTPIYIGETGNFATRRPGSSHEKWAEAQRYGATHVMAHRNDGGEAARKAEETDLIRAYSPPANSQGLRAIFATESSSDQAHRTTILTRS